MVMDSAGGMGAGRQRSVRRILGQANLPAVLAALALACAAMWLTGWVGDHAATGAHVLACITRTIGG